MYGIPDLSMLILRKLWNVHVRSVNVIILIPAHVRSVNVIILIPAQCVATCIWEVPLDSSLLYAPMVCVLSP